MRTTRGLAPSTTTPTTETVWVDWLRKRRGELRKRRGELRERAEATC